MSDGKKKVVIIGGGPAGLTASYELCKVGIDSVVLEKDVVVGGLAKTINHQGYFFDIGGHRFFTRVKSIDDIWREVLPNGRFLRRRRLSRIYYNKKFFYYPLRSYNALFGLGFFNSILILLSYLRAQMFPDMPEENFKQWISNRFGRRLYNIFFETYTEKVWGIPCDEIKADWAAQRVKGLSLRTAIKSALGSQRAKDRAAVIRTLADEFDYPERGPGMMWETMASIIEERGGQVRLGGTVEQIFWTGSEILAVEINTGEKKELIEGTHFISSMPIKELIRGFVPPPPAGVLEAANSLNYRDFLTVALIVNQAELFLDNWIYIHTPNVKVGRIQNFKNWSPHMVPDAAKTCLGLEYFCFQGDELWNLTDQELIALAKKELETLGLVRPADVEGGAVVRVPKAYPVYDSTYKESLRIVRQFVDRISNLQLVGRNGLHKYNNQDHSMLTAMLAVKNILGANHDLWMINTDQEYQEVLRFNGNKEADETVLLASTQPEPPMRESMKDSDLLA